MKNILKFKSQSETWNDGLPVGNGRLAALLEGTGDRERVHLNNEFLWTGFHKDRKCDESAYLLSHVRDCLLKGEYFKANALSAVAFGGGGGISPLLRRIDSYSPAYSLVFSGLGAFLGRSLSLEDGVASSVHEAAALTLFASLDEDRIFILLDNPTPFSTIISYEREDEKGVKADIRYNAAGIDVVLDRAPGVSFKSRVRIQSDGMTKGSAFGLLVSNATRVCLSVDIKSESEEETLPEFNSIFPDPDLTLKAHRERFSSLFNKSVISLEDEEETEELFMEERLTRLKGGKRDSALLALYANFGRYLFISGTKGASLPLNLQGKWNKDVYPKWNSDYHFNINLEMCYWLASPFMEDEAMDTLLDYLLSLLPAGREAAGALYGCRGITLTLSSDISRSITPEAYNYAVWIGGAGWLSAQLFKHYRYSGDKEFLSRAWPFIREAALFYSDYIIFSPEGVALIMPSQSPENRFEGAGYFPVSISINSAMDKQICRDALTSALDAASELGLSDSEAERWNKILSSLPPCGIGKDGRLLEWDSEDKVEIEKGHRHFSHLYGVYPSALFTPERNSKQFKAAEKSLDYRLAHDGGYTGWSLAWAACLRARFLDGKKAEEALYNLIRDQASASLMDLHPDYFPQIVRPEKGNDDPFLFGREKNLSKKVFQIDGNLGAVAALTECLIQCREGTVHLLPSPLLGVKKGTFGPVRAEDGNRYTFTFEPGSVKSLTITFGYREEAKINCNGKTMYYKGEKDSTIAVL